MKEEAEGEDAVSSSSQLARGTLFLIDEKHCIVFFGRNKLQSGHFELTFPTILLLSQLAATEQCVTFFKEDLGHVPYKKSCCIIHKKMHTPIPTSPPIQLNGSDEVSVLANLHQFFLKNDTAPEGGNIS